MRSIDQGYGLAHVPMFQESLGLPLPAQTGIVAAIVGATGQLTVDIDGALVWPLNGAVYAVDDRVCLLFLSPLPESGWWWANPERP